MNRSIVAIVFFLSCLPFLSGGQDKVFLINGNKLKGAYIPALSTDTTLYLAIYNHGMHVPYNIIKAAKFSRASKSRGLGEALERIYPPYKLGLYNRVGVTGYLGTHSYWDDMDFNIGFNSVTGYKWSNLKNVGFKTGVDIYEDYITVPLAVHYEVELNKRNTSPIFMGGIGYGLAWKRNQAEVPFNKIRGGWHYYLSGGYRFNAPWGGNMILRIGGSRQQVVQEVDNPDDPRLYYSVLKQKRNIRRFAISLDLTL